MITYICFPLHTRTGITIGFERDRYTAQETLPTVEVCARIISGNINPERDAVVRFFTQDGTAVVENDAVGEYKSSITLCLVSWVGFSYTVCIYMHEHLVFNLRLIPTTYQAIMRLYSLIILCGGVS